MKAMGRTIAMAQSLGQVFGAQSSPAASPL